MYSLTKIALAEAIVLGSAFTASAATRHHGVSHARPATYNVAPADTISDRCLPSGPPCRTEPDGW